MIPESLNVGLVLTPGYAAARIAMSVRPRPDRTFRFELPDSPLVVGQAVVAAG